MGVWLHNQSKRLYGIDTAEIRGGTVETKALGNLAKDYLNELPETAVLLRTYIDKRGKFGRVLASVVNRKVTAFRLKARTRRC